jgi:hypothetical protein
VPRVTACCRRGCGSVVDDGIGSDVLWQRERRGRDAGEGGEFRDVVKSPACLLIWCRDPAGDDAERRRRRVTMKGLFPCELAPGKHVRRCAREQEEEGISREGAEVFYRTVFGGNR